MGGGARIFIPDSHIARTVLQVHGHLQIGVQRKSGNCDHQEAGGSRQEERQDGEVM